MGEVFALVQRPHGCWRYGFVPGSPYLPSPCRAQVRRFGVFQGRLFALLPTLDFGVFEKDPTAQALCQHLLGLSYPLGEGWTNCASEARSWGSGGSLGGLCLDYELEEMVRRMPFVLLRDCPSWRGSPVSTWRSFAAMWYVVRVWCGLPAVKEDHKTSFRQQAKVQHLKITNVHAVKLLNLVYQGAAKDELLFFGSASVFRRRWDFLLQKLEVPTSVHVTPGGLRGGGAVASYRKGAAISDLLWAMRLRQIATLESYLQEVAAMSLLTELPSSSRRAIRSAASLYAFLTYATGWFTTCSGLVWLLWLFSAPMCAFLDGGRGLLVLAALFHCGGLLALRWILLWTLLHCCLCDVPGLLWPPVLLLLVPPSPSHPGAEKSVSLCSGAASLCSLNIYIYIYIIIYIYYISHSWTTGLG